MKAVTDARVITKDARPKGVAVRPTFKVELWSGGVTVVDRTHVVGKPVEPVARSVFWDELPGVSVRRVQSEEVPVSDPWQKWFAQLGSFRALRAGWNSYTAPAPEDMAIRSAGMFLAELRAQGCEPTRVAPSAMGGIAITRRQGDRKGFVEFYNNGKVYALFADRKGDMRVVPVQADAPSFRRLILEMRDYLNG